MLPPEWPCPLFKKHRHFLLLFPEAIREVTSAYFRVREDLKSLGVPLGVDIIFSFVYQVQFSCLPPMPVAVGVGLEVLRSQD